MHLLQVNFVTNETFLVQRSRSSYGLHHTWERTWPLRNVHDVHDVHVEQFQDSNAWRNWQLLLQVIYFVNQYEAMFSTERLKISKCT